MIQSEPELISSSDPVSNRPDPRPAPAPISGFAFRVYACHVDRLRVGWHHESRRCSRDTYPESYITKYISAWCVSGGGCFGGVWSASHCAYPHALRPHLSRISGFGSRVSGFGFRACGSGSGLWDLEEVEASAHAEHPSAVNLTYRARTYSGTRI